MLLKWYEIESYIDNTKLKERKFAGMLNKNKPVADFLRHLGIISGIESYFDAEGILNKLLLPHFWAKLKTADYLFTVSRFTFAVSIHL